MPLTQLVYASRAAARVDTVELHAIAGEASANNALRGVTGMLLFCDGFFVQMLEGEDAVLRGLFAKIGADPRHADVRLLLCAPVKSRAFGEWGMAGRHADALGDADRARLASLVDRLDAGACGFHVGEAVRAMLSDLKPESDVAPLAVAA